MTLYLNRTSCDVSPSNVAPGEMATAEAVYTHNYDGKLTTTVEGVLYAPDGTVAETVVAADRAVVPAGGELVTTADFEMPSAEGSYDLSMEVYEEYIGTGNPIVESFEHGSDEHWNGTGPGRVVQVPDAPHGDMVFELDRGIRWVHPTSSVPEPYFANGELMRAGVRALGPGERPTVMFAVPNIWNEGNKYYAVRVSVRDNELELVKRDNTGWNSIDTMTVSLTENQWYHVDILRENGIQIGLKAPGGDQIANVSSPTDDFPDFIGYGVESQGARQSPCQFDNFRLL